MIVNRTLSGTVLAKLGKYSTIRLETGETQKVTVPCQSRIGEKVHVYIDRTINKIVRVIAVGLPDIDDDAVELCAEEDILPNDEDPTLLLVEHQEVLGRQWSEGDPGVGSREVLGRQENERDESMLDDIFEEFYLTTMGIHPSQEGDLEL